MKKILFIILPFPVVLFSFQNCSMPGFEAINVGSGSLFKSSVAKTECEKQSSLQRQNCFAVTKIYHDHLKRDPGLDDLNQWSSILNRGEMSLNKVTDIISNSVEAKAVQQASSRSILWGAWIDGIPPEQGQQFQSRQQFNSMAGKKMGLAGAVAWWYPNQPWSNFDDLFNNPSNPAKNWANLVHEEGAMPVLMWQIYDPNAPACDSPAFIDHVKKYSPKSVARGDHDQYIRLWARQIKAWGKPIYMRTMHELNFKRQITDPCTQYFTSWDADVEINGHIINKPQDVVAAWKKVVDIFRAEGAHNAKWIWSVLSAPSANFGGGNPISLASIYPGDAYVDWIGIECYNFKEENWLGCSDRMEGIYAEAAALSPVLPIMNVEMGTYQDSRKPGWLKDALDVNSPQAMVNRYPRLNSFMYWNDSRYHGLWIKSSEASAQAFKSSIAHSTYQNGYLNSGSTLKSCRLNGVEIAEGHSQVFYKSQTAKDCHSLSQTRRCVAGQLDGSDHYLFATCLDVMDEAAATSVVIRLMVNNLGRTQVEASNDHEGIAFWVGRLRQGLTESDLKNHFLDSDEYFVRLLYQSILKRRPDISEIKYYLSELASARMSKSQLKAHFNWVCSQKINGECGGNNSDGNGGTENVPGPGGTAPDPVVVVDYHAIVIDAMRQVLGRSLAEARADSAGISYWAQRLAGGYSTVAMQNDMRNSDEYFLRMAYKNILRRNPQMSEIQYYTNELKAHRMTRPQIQQHFRYVCTNRIGGEC